MTYSRTALSPCDWHRRRDTGLRSFFLSVRGVPPYKSSHWEKLQCMVRTGWITPIIFSLGRRRKWWFQKNKGQCVPLQYDSSTGKRVLSPSPLPIILCNCTYMDAFWANCPTPVRWEGWCIPWGLCLGSGMEKAEHSGVPWAAVGRKGDWQNWWCRHW